MASGIIHYETIHVGKYSEYSVGRPWASGERPSPAINYAPCGWREDAGPVAGLEFRPLAAVVAAVVANAMRGYFPELRSATLEFLRSHPFDSPQYSEGLDWTMGAKQAAFSNLGTQRAADGLIEQPQFREAWLRALGIAA